MLWSPVIALALVTVVPRVRPLLVGCALLVLALPPALGNELRPLVAGGDESILRRSRPSLYFSEARHLERAFTEATALVARSGCRRVGLDLSYGVGNQLEYALLALLGAERGERTVSALGVVERSDGGAAPPADVCAIVCVACTAEAERDGGYERVGDRIAVSDTVVVYVPRGRP